MYANIAIINIFSTRISRMKLLIFGFQIKKSQISARI